MRRLAWIVLLAACGAPARAPSDPAALARALDAWSRGDLATVRAIASATPSAPPALIELGGRAALAEGDPEGALAILEGPRDEPIVRVRATARLARGDWGGAARELATLRGAADDPLADAIARVAGEVHGRALLERAGADRESLAWERDAALPVVRVTVEGRESLALVATSVRTTVLDPALRADHGVIDELALGRARLRAVPFFVRPLDVESAALGVALGAVIGLDVLEALGATIDGHGLALGGEGGGEALPACRLDGSFLAVEIAADGRRGWWLVDTAGAFAAAWTPAGLERAGAPAGSLDLGIGATTLLGVPIEQGVVSDDVEQLTRAPVEGALGWGLLSTIALSIDRRGVRVVGALLTATGG